MPPYSEHRPSAFPRLYQTQDGWAYDFLPPGQLLAEIRAFPSYRAALIAGITRYCQTHPAWREENGLRTFRQAALAMGLPYDPPSKAEALRRLREQRHPDP